MDIVIQKNIQVPMRDDVRLAADVYRPAGDAPAPTLVMRSPYNKEFPGILSISIDVLRAVQAGYAVLIQDCRGRYLSAGEFNPFFQEAQDGLDTIAWAARQPWSNGKVGTIGILRARYRNSPAMPELLEPDTIYELHIDLVATANVFRAGHRIGLDISSSNFPRFDRNTNTGGIIAGETAADCVPALNRIFHDQARRSHLILPIIERS